MLDYDRLAEEYAQHRGVHPGVLRSLISRGIDSSSRVLEVGCGTANYLEALHRATGCVCSGIEPSEKMLAKARDRGVEAQLARGRAEQLGFVDGSFDLVFSVDVIHHVVDRTAYYAYAYRVLASGGAVCTATDSEEIIRQRQPLALYFPETIEVELARYPRMADLRQMMLRAGFGQINETTVEVESTTTDLQMYRDKAFSSLHLIAKDAFDRGIRRMEDDLRAGPISCVSRYVMLWGEK